MHRISLVFILCVSASFAQSIRNEVVPAGTLLQCTLSEPNFSSKTATEGDPVLCHIGSLVAFGHSVFPRGAELSGHLQDYKNPGRFFGKGWLDVQFDRLVLPGDEVLPISAKVISVPKLRVDKEGKIHGKGHAKRDAIGWMIPPLWPIKVLTLPARGPYPAFKGETRVTLRLLEDIQVQPSVAATATVLTPARQETAGTSQQVAYRLVTSASDNSASRPPVLSLYRTGGSSQPNLDHGQNQRFTLIVLKGGAAYVARQYWVEDGQMKCTGDNGEEQRFSLESIDLDQTVRLNHERNVEFIIQNKEFAVQSQEFMAQSRGEVAEQ